MQTGAWAKGREPEMSSTQEGQRGRERESRSKIKTRTHVATLSQPGRHRDPDKMCSSLSITD